MTDRKIIEELVQQELKEANEKYPLFSSAHEAYAVLLEEIEEAAEDLRMIYTHKDALWGLIKADAPYFNGNFRTIKVYAESLAAEAIQIAAMCQKAAESAV